MPLSALASGAKILGGLGGLFGNKKGRTPSMNVLSTAKGARQAAEKFGFNPLTMLMYGTGAAGAGVGDGFPDVIASTSLMAQGFEDMHDEVSGKNALERQQAELKTDLMKLEIERMKAEAAAAGSLLAGSKIHEPSRGRGGQQVTTVEGPNGTAINYDKGREQVMVAGHKITPHEGWSDAEAIEKRYGDAVSWAYGVGTAAADAYATLRDFDKGTTRPKPEGGIDLGEGFEGNFNEGLSEEDLHELLEGDRQIYGDTPDGYTADGYPYWIQGRGITTIPPNQRFK